MLRVRGSPLQLCDGWTRRDVLQAGGLGALGLSLADFFRLQEAQAARPAHHEPKNFGKAKSCILLYLYGAASQIETFDPKPAAPPEIRGTLGTIRSSLPGLDVGELLPQTAKIMDKVTVLRSVTHPYPIHGVAFATTGIPTITVEMELSPRDGRHWPYIGSVIDYLGKRSGRKPPVPDNLALPFPMSTRRTGEVARAGPYAAFLGNAYNPIWTEFRGKATKTFRKSLAGTDLDVEEPYMGVTPTSRFELAASVDAPPDLTLDRLDTRRSLADQFDLARRDFEGTEAGKSLNRYREMAYNLIHSTRVRTALDVQQEPMPLRESYGMTLFGQSALTARRLVEAGSRFVSVFWDEYGLAGSAWDTHWDHYNRMKQELCPGLDHGVYGLIRDLDQRGMLDETLVVLLTEHGRTPRISAAKGGGRDHWSQVYSIMLAGAGIARGRVIGKSDKIAGTVAERPVSPKEILATIYHLLGIPHETLLQDRTGRPMPLVVDASVLEDVLA